MNEIVLPFSTAPFRLAPGRPTMRALSTLEGIGDRLRFVAFAELQAREAFFWAAQEFANTAPPALTLAWKKIGAEEGKHHLWLLERMRELGVDPGARPQSTALWESLVSQKSVHDFAWAMGSAEERGRVAGLLFHRELLNKDPKTAELFRQISAEEEEHVVLARECGADIRQ